MSFLPLDWRQTETETPTASPTEVPAAAGRAAVFHSALEAYLADYERQLCRTEQDRRGRLVSRTPVSRLMKRLWA